MVAALPAGGLPFFRVGQCTTLREAGRRHGRLAAQRIRAILETDEISEARAFVAVAADSGKPGLGATALRDLRADNTSAFPMYAEEIAGIAEGAGVDVLDIWLMNLLAEVEALMGLPPDKRVERCSDIMLRGDVGELWHGHNEDWTNDRMWHDSVYFIAYDAGPGANFASVMGMCYPGMIPGFAMTWANTGLLLTQNSLFPPTARRRGLGCIFVARRALEEGTIERAISRLVRPGQALGCAVNLVELSRHGESPRACSVEVYGFGDEAAVRWLGQDIGSSLLHFNVYSFLRVGNANNPRNSASRRSRTIKLLAGAPRSNTSGAHDVSDVLADTKTNFLIHPIHGAGTMASWLLDTKAMTVTVWARGRPGHATPLYEWDVRSFFACACPGSVLRESNCPATLARITSGVDCTFGPWQVRPTESLHPVLCGVHRADLRIRREVKAALSDIARGRGDDPNAAVKELNALRRQLLRKVRGGQISEVNAVKLFRDRLCGGRQHGGEPPQLSADATPASISAAAALCDSKGGATPLVSTLVFAAAEAWVVPMLVVGVFLVALAHASTSVASLPAVAAVRVALVALSVVLVCYAILSVSLNDRGIAALQDALHELRHRFAERLPIGELERLDASFFRWMPIATCGSHEVACSNDV